MKKALMLIAMMTVILVGVVQAADWEDQVHNRDEKEAKRVMKQCTALLNIIQDDLNTIDKEWPNKSCKRIKTTITHIDEYLNGFCNPSINPELQKYKAELVKLNKYAECK